MQFYINFNNINFNYFFYQIKNRHLACEEQRIEAAKQLLKHGANPHIKNKVRFLTSTFKWICLCSYHLI